jgi:hypothetical protein
VDKYVYLGRRLKYENSNTLGVFDDQFLTRKLGKPGNPLYNFDKYIYIVKYLKTF